MQRIANLFFYLVFAAVLTSCGQQTNSPAGIAEQFWDAVQANDVEKARSLAVAGTMDNVRLDETDDGPGKKEFGDAEIADDTASVPTHFTGIDYDLNFATVLEREGGQWRVDYNATVNSMIAASLKLMGEAISDAMKEGTEEVGKALSEGARELGKALEGIAKELDSEKSSD